MGCWFKEASQYANSGNFSNVFSGDFLLRFMLTTLPFNLKTDDENPKKGNHYCNDDEYSSTNEEILKYKSSVLDMLEDNINKKSEQQIKLFLLIIKSNEKMLQRINKILSISTTN